ncbi:sulfatase [Bacteroidia bacterium]|nr:sulfatase [Bacteroidia bacterium]
MLYNTTFSKECTWGDYLQVMLHGLKLDSSMAAYVVAIPFLLVIATIWLPKMNLRKILPAYYGLISFLIAAAFVIDTSLYVFWNFKLDATILFYMDSPSNMVASEPMWFFVLRFLVAILWAGGLYWVLMQVTPGGGEVREVKEVRGGSVCQWVRTGVMILVGGLLFVCIRGGVTESTSNIGRAYFSDNQFLNHSAVNPVASFCYSLGTTEKYADQFNFLPESERAAAFEDLYPKGGETATRLLNTDRPNVLIILWEGLGGCFTEAIGGDSTITPRFNHLVKEGVYFANYYSNSFRTDRGTLAALSGYPAFPTLSVMKLPAKSRTLPAIAKSLVQAGYATDFLYGGDIDFTNMQSYLRSTGYQHVTSDKDFSLKEQQSNAWGVNDDITFEHLYQVIQKRANAPSDKPWHTGFLTLSSHEPFKVPYNRPTVSADVTNPQENVLNAFAYTDDILGRFIDKLKTTPAWENLMIVIIPDHGFSYPKQLTSHDPDFFHTPMLWIGGAVKEPMQVDKILNQTDLAATLLAQLNLPHADFEWSRDIFSTAYTYPFAFFSFNNGFGFKDSSGVSVFDNNAEKWIFEQPTASTDREKRGKAILQTLYDDLDQR